MELRNKKITFLGDSITEGSGASRPENCYVSVFEKSTGAKCVNLGIGGTRIAKQHKPTEYSSVFDKDFCSRVCDIDEDSDIVVVFGGTNDFGHGDAAIGSPDDRTPDTFYGALHTLYRSLLERLPKAKIVVLTPLHRATEENPCGDNKPAPVATLKEYVDIIRSVAEIYSLPVLDLFASSGLQPRVDIINKTFFADGLHPNDAGHAVVAEKIESFLRVM